MRREVVRILRIWSQTLLPPAITMTLYFVIFGSLIGSRVGQIAHGPERQPDLVHRIHRARAWS